MNRLRAAIRNAADTLAASVQLRAHEIRTGITVIDAVAADDLNTQLLVGTGNPAIAHDLRVMALDLMKAGVQPDEIEHLAHLHQRMRGLDVTPEDALNAALMRHRGERIELPEMVHVHHHDMEAHAASFNEGYEAAMAQHIALDPSVAQDWLVEQKAAAWTAGVGTALNHAITNDDGITLRLQHTDDRPWLNPYSGEPYPIPTEEVRS